MKKRLLATVLMVLPLAGMANDAGHDRHEKKTPHYVVKMTEQLGLSAEQSATLERIFIDHREKMRALREETEQKVDALLTEEQRATLQALKEERNMQRKAQHGERRHEDGRKNRKQDDRREPHHHH